MKLLVVDDHPLVREAIVAFLALQFPDAVIEQANDLPAALAICERTAGLGAVVLDLVLPGVDGVGAVEAFQHRWPDLPILVLTASEDPEQVRRALAKGARGFVPKSASRDTLVAALAMVLQGEVFVPELMLHAPPPMRVAAHKLTVRQTEVLRLLCQGQSNKHIALSLGMSERTVKVHVAAIFRALDVFNRTQAAIAAQAAGLV